jgi:hypothetical protein
MPRFPTEDPDYRIIWRVPSPFLHYYFYIRDPVIGRWQCASVRTFPSKPRIT